MRKFQRIQDQSDSDLIEKLNADANTIMSRNTLVVAIFCCVLFVIEEMTRIDENTNFIKHVLVDCVTILIASFIPIVLKRLKVRETLIMHSFAISYIIVLSVIIITFDGVQYGGITVWADLLIMVFISMSYYSNSIFLIYSFVFGLFWIVTFMIRYPYLETYIDLSDHIGRIGIFIIMCGIALWGNKMIWRQMMDNHKQLLIIQQYSKDLEQKNEELQRLDKLKNEFLSNTTHELRTPLHSIIGLLEPLLESKSDALKPDEFYDISFAVSNAKRLYGLVGDILDFSKLRNHEITLQKQNIDLYILMRIVCKSFEHQTMKKNIRLTNAIPPDFELICADENRFLQIMFNLIGNAVKFTESGDIRISATKTADQIQVTVSDTGIGIEPERQQYIFNDFEQGDSSISREYGGTGLGLTITKSLVELHGGNIWVESTPGKGSQFTFSIPFCSADGVQTARPATVLQETWENIAEPDYNIQPELVQGVNDAEAPRILIIDDEPVNIRIVRNMLSKEGYSLTPAYGGKQALKMLQEGQQFDLVLLDVMMPYISGFDVCSRIRETYSLSQLPVLLLTAMDMSEDYVIGFQVGANDFLQKPFNAKELTARVKTLLELKKSTEKMISAELFYLQSQIKPHFLYNTLNTITAYIRTDPDLAREMIVELSGYLQENFNFKFMEKAMPISKEISIVKSYLFIEKARFSDKLKVEYNIDERAKCSIPHLLLQPIVENAVRHGILEKQSGGTVRISVKRDGPDVLITIEDDGVGINSELIPELLQHKVDGAGIGLYNVHRRMTAIYGHGLEMESQPGHGTKVWLRVPGQEDA